LKVVNKIQPQKKQISVRPLGKLVKEEIREVVREAESQITGADFTRKSDEVKSKKVEVEAEEQEQLAAVRRRLREIKEELAAASQKISQEREEKCKVRENEEEHSFPVVQSLPPEVASKPKSHMPPKIGMERRKKI